MTDVPESLNDRVNDLEASLNLFIDFVMQNQRDQQVQLQTQQAQIDALTRGQQSMMAAIEQLNRNQVNMTEAMRELAIAQQETFTVIREMQSEVRGLQTENRRILEILSERQQPPEASA